ncbi:MAG: tetratricopeptide repeat protein [Candidatus Latescibacteria bacterium]|jgi:arabinofuranosyltransferase|nr:tetratricopeptide repeat protein [Candidatus Latescibacterota bacterium]
MTVHKNAWNVLLALCLSAFAVVVVRRAWLTDDAYITFRTVDNFIHGLGLTWNVGERVQVYTHPLWMLMVSVIYFLTREIYYSSVFLSIGVSLAAVLLLALRAASSIRTAILGVAILACSKAFVDYSTSGLENPLNHLILASFFLVYLRSDTSPGTLFKLSLLAGLGLLSRMDLALIFAPALAQTFLQLRGQGRVRPVALGFLPFLAWEAFAVFYYGFPFPNTAYAKLNTGIGGLELAEQGLFYLWYSSRIDPVMPLAILGGIAISLVADRSRRLPIVLGLLLYLLYVVKIGGDFMSGRFLTAPLFCAVILLVQQVSTGLRAWLPAFGAVVAIGLFTPQSPIRSGSDYGALQGGMRQRGVEDQRGFLYRHAGLLRHGSIGRPTHHWAAEGEQARANGTRLALHGPIGYFGYYAGPETHILDVFALADPLLARLPAGNPLGWRIGHFERRIPVGYAETLASPESSLRDGSLAAYYGKLAVVTRGDLFDDSRWAEIWRLNTGAYDDLLGFEYHRHQIRGFSLAERGRALAAQRALESSIAADPTRAEGWCVLARLHQQIGNPDEARTALLRAVDLAPSQTQYASQLLELGHVP